MSQQRVAARRQPRRTGADRKRSLLGGLRRDGPLPFEHHASRLRKLVGRQTRSHTFAEINHIGEVPVRV